MTIEPIIQNVGRCAAQWWQGAQSFVQEIQSSIRRSFENGQQRQIYLNTKYPQISEPSNGASSGPSTAFRDLEPWRKNPAWQDDTPVMESVCFRTATAAEAIFCAQAFKPLRSLRRLVLKQKKPLRVWFCPETQGQLVAQSNFAVLEGSFLGTVFGSGSVGLMSIMIFADEVTVPEGSLCQLNSIFKVGLPPMAVFDILSDPGNKRVFKNIKEVKHRKLLEDYGHRQIVELEQAAIWRFLWLSGTLSVCVRVDQDRQALTLKYDLAKEGFMKKFEGSWEIQPLYIDMDDGTESRGRVASLVHLQQVVQPAIMPPPPLVRYIRGITTRTTEKMLEDLQEEGRRLREGRAIGDEVSEAEEKVHRRAAAETEKNYVLRRHWKLHTNAGGLSRSQRRRRRKVGRFL